jgi:hypothetical protein
MQDKIWVTRDGRRIVVAQMATSHIQHCIAKIERSGGRWRGEYLERLRLEVAVRSLPTMRL